MIALVAGEVAVRRPDHVVVLAAGVGYQLAVSNETLRQVPAIGHEARLYAHMVVREDAILLYGFATEEERDLFLLLIGVQGVGPKVALAVLGGGTPRDLVKAIAQADAARFQAVPGIGKKIAERIVAELREKVTGLAAPIEASEDDEDIVITRSDDPRRLARDGLIELGFSIQEADELMRGAEGETAEDFVAHALRAARK